MQNQSCKSNDGTRIVYDLTGDGPALVLLHGLGKNRKDWQKLGYVQRLQEHFTVISIDLRGTGESDLKIRPEDYAIERICEDIISVVDACKIDIFSMVGYSYGGIILRYLGVWFAHRIRSIVIIGVPLGVTVDADFDAYIEQFIKKYGALQTAETSPPIPKKSKIKSQIPGMIACFQAIRTWPDVDYRQPECPTLLIFGSKNQSVVNWYRENRDIPKETQISIEMIAGLTHQQEFSQSHQIIPIIESFLIK